MVAFTGRLKGVPFFRCLLYQRVGISRVEGTEGRELCLFGRKVPKVPNKCLVSVKRARSRSGFVIFFSYFKGMQKSKLGM